jgi:hypothetical protein
MSVAGWVSYCITWHRGGAADVGFPMGDGRLSFTDGQTRFTGGLMATNLIM